MGSFPLPFVLPSVPGFPTSQLSPSSLMWFSLKRTTCSRPKPQLSTGNPGKPRDLQFHGPFLEMFFDRGDEKRPLSSNRSPWKLRPPLCHPDRSEAERRDLQFRGPSWKCFSTEVMKDALCPATALHGSVALPFVIPTEAKRSGEICSSADLSWKCFSTEVMKNALCPATALHGSVALPFVIPSVAEGSAVPQTFPGNVFRP
jgi:hypothetical protein